MLQDPYQTKRVLIVVRTYPTPAKKGVEVSCTAGITDTGEWLRLFPVPYRFLPPERRFTKYQWIEVGIKKATSDSRPESHNVQGESIKIVSSPLSTAHAWRARKEWVNPLKSHCLCCLKGARDTDGFPTLGFIKPKTIERLVIEADDLNWSQSQLETLSQGDLFAAAPEEDLEKIPFTFRYKFRCDHFDCTGHELSCTDWEMGQSWRSWRKTYGDQWEQKFRQRYETELIEQRDTHFYVGTIHQHPSAWIIVGLFYPPFPPDDEQAEMFGD